jgi:hypothetical protein
MTSPRLLKVSERWFTLLLRLYPPDFRDEMGRSLVETYCDQARAALTRRGLRGLAGLWLRALHDAMHCEAERGSAWCLLQHGDLSDGAATRSWLFAA